ncbi:hypothetical protein HJG60_010873 [Phyllostomus discolor]|uniref:Anthrax toxin receptor extracellular domain-containing protein n=1 Tax=Phyllostomus discolor TaxID=89673 RepID=A0A834AC43_9CHIR|nr:hypothetical protein HJG60_010873 [Phyllostomus discolor]
MGTTIYGVGVNDYKEKQLLAIADSKYHTFGVNTGFTGLKDIVDSLATRSCIEITTVKPSSICAKENYELNVSGKGFKNAKNKNEVICRFKFSKNKVFGLIIPGSPQSPLWIAPPIVIVTGLSRAEETKAAGRFGCLAGRMRTQALSKPRGES